MFCAPNTRHVLFIIDPNMQRVFVRRLYLPILGGSKPTYIVLKCTFSSTKKRTSRGVEIMCKFIIIKSGIMFGPQIYSVLVKSLKSKMV